MRNLLRELKEICAKFPLDEKVVLVPSHSAGQELLVAMGQEGYSCLNLKPDTLHGLVTRITQDYLFQHDLNILPDTLADHIFQSILQKLKASDAFKYFTELEIKPGISRVIGNAILELKMSGFTPQLLPEEQFISKEKGADLKIIFTEYEETLKSLNFYDNADLFNLAINLCNNENEKTIYIIPSNLKVNSLEKQFLATLCKDSQQFIYLSSVNGLDIPQAYFVDSIPENNENIATNIDRLRWLYSIENAPPPINDNSIEFFQAYGESNEVKEIIRRIKNGQIALDKTAVFYTAREPYSQLFFDLALKLELPITFGEGIDIKNTKPGRLFFTLLEWLRSNFDVTKFIPILTGGYFKITGDGLLHSYKIAGILRSAGIGWGRERYIEQLEKEISILQEKLFEETDENKKEKYSSRLDDLIGTKDFISHIFKLIPKENVEGNYHYGELTQGISSFIDNYSNVTSELDGEGKKVIIESLSVIGEYGQEYISLEEILLCWENIIGGLRVNKTTPKPGYMHIDTYKKGVWIYRPNNFVVGLDGVRFPGQYREDPIILDMERKQLSPNLYLRKLGIKENIYAMAQTLASLIGRITLSYSAFDTVENRDIFPSSLLLQAYRLVTGDITKDYSQLISFLDHKAGFIPKSLNDATDYNEYWLNLNFVEGGIKEPERALKNCFTGLASGLRAWQERAGTLFTSYDGQVQVESTLVDPRKNHQLVISASQLETLAKCPFGYYLKYLLNISPPDDLKYDPGVWLDPASRGTLLHKIYETFYKKLKTNKEKPILALHESLLYEVADELLAEMKGELPPPSEVIYEYECREIKESCRVFLACEEEECVGVTPCHFELAFGFEKTSDPGLGEIKPVFLTLPSGEKIYLKGKIDRVDQAEDNSYIILDYKTGSTYSFDENKFYQCGKQLQHTLYAAALENILTECSECKDPKVKAGGYVFPTKKGEGQRFMRAQDNRKPFYEIIETLCDILKSGTFVMTDEDNDCTYCDYIEVCQKTFFREALEVKLSETANTQLDLFRRLKKYE